MSNIKDELNRAGGAGANVSLRDGGVNRTVLITGVDDTKLSAFEASDSGSEEGGVNVTIDLANIEPGSISSAESHDEANE